MVRASSSCWGTVDGGERISSDAGHNLVGRVLPLRSNGRASAAEVSPVAGERTSRWQARKRSVRNLGSDYAACPLGTDCEDCGGCCPEGGNLNRDRRRNQTCGIAAFGVFILLAKGWCITRHFLHRREVCVAGSILALLYASVSVQMSQSSHMECTNCS